jgi:hypothetical protein
LLEENKVEYLVVGAFALGFYGSPRSTGDIDVWIKVDAENAKRIVKTLDAFGLASLGYKESDFLDRNMIVQLGVPPVRIDIIMGISGVEFEEAYRNKVTVKKEGVRIDYISRNDFIKNKKASGRLKDLADIESISKMEE